MTVNNSIRGCLLVPSEEQHTWTLVEDGVIEFDKDGKITSVSPAGEDCEVRVTRPGSIWLPGFVDTHIHFPQTRIRGSASGELLPWLQTSVFPEESKFVEAAYATEVARVFCNSMLSHGTTCASIFSSSDPGATNILFETMHEIGLRGDVGLTLMNRGAPDVLLHDTAEAMDACEQLVEEWHGVDRDRLRFCVTPRFALSCTPDLLRAAGDFASKHDLTIQTHISENHDEITATLEMFPGSEDYLRVYEDAGLLTQKSLFAHGVWLTDREWDDIADKKSSVSHCPDSNFFLGSGAMPLSKAIEREIKTGLGTDIGAGRSFSLRKCCSRGYDASRMSGSKTDAGELLWLATRGGALAMSRGDQIGLLASGYDADLVNIELEDGIPSTVELICEKLVFGEDWSGVREVRIRGAVVWSSEDEGVRAV